MITFLSKLFVPNRENVRDANVRKAYGMLCGGVGIFFNLCLFALKLLAGTISHSIAITADALNNLSDAGSSIITLIGFKMAGQKPDPDHPFGHGRIEYIAGLVVSMLILLMGFELLKSSVTKILHPELPDFSVLVIVILMISIVTKCYMFLYNRRIGRLIDSAAMQATATDSLSDTAATTVVLIATVVSHFTGLCIDGWCGMAVGLFICYAGYNAAKDTISPLLGQPPEEDFVRQISDIVMSHEEILGIHDLIVHDYGPGRLMISLHAEVPAMGDILKLHDTIDNIERELHTTLQCHAVIHMDPVQNDDETTCQLKQLVLRYLREIDSSLSMHDFRVVTGPTHTNLIFDIVVPYNYSIPDEALAQKLSERIHTDHAEYFAVIHVDKKMV